jgi:catechol 2,3-dioxygenase
MTGVPAPNYRLPSATHVGPVTLQVTDLARSLDYYTNVLGLTPLSRDEDGATLGAADRTPLVTLHERPGAAAVPRTGLLGLYHFAILLPDDVSLGRFILHLANLGIPAGMSDHAVSQAVYLTDPDGLGIEVYADRPRSEWRTNGDQLLMTSAPLDANSLAEIAGDTGWEGMPAGTRMGHIHLHVGDIEIANRFYHEQLGLDRMVWSYPGALFLSAGGYHHHLGLNTWARGARPAGPDDARLLSWTLVLPTAQDVDAAVENFENATETHAGWSIPDPWGTTVTLRAEAVSAVRWCPSGTPG